MRAMDFISMVLLVIGGINWGLVGAFDYNLVAELFGTEAVLSNIIYGLVGIAALWALGSLVPRMTTDMSHHDRHMTT